MKNIIKGITAVSLLILMVFCFSSCNDFNFNLFGDNSDNTEAVAATDATYVQAEKVDGKYVSVEDYANSQEIQGQLQTYQSAFSDNFIIKIYGDGNKFIYEFKYLEKIPSSDIETRKQEIEKSLEEQKDTYTDIAEDISKKVNIDKEDVIVAIRYINADESLITEVDFTVE